MARRPCAQPHVHKRAQVLWALTPHEVVHMVTELLAGLEEEDDVQPQTQIWVHPWISMPTGSIIRCSFLNTEIVCEQHRLLCIFMITLIYYI